MNFYGGLQSHDTVHLSHILEPVGESHRVVTTHKTTTEMLRVVFSGLLRCDAVLLGSEFRHSKDRTVCTSKRPAVHKDVWTTKTLKVKAIHY